MRDAIPPKWGEHHACIANKKASVSALRQILTLQQI